MHMDLLQTSGHPPFHNYPRFQTNAKQQHRTYKITYYGWYSGKDLSLLNLCRMFLQVIWLSDICMGNRSAIQITSWQVEWSSIGDYNLATHPFSLRFQMVTVATSNNQGTFPGLVEKIVSTTWALAFPGSASWVAL